ncbi:hypothetical protein BJ508DRAFT_314108 [Ascobolus immersus RN42]|uniref:Ty3 transposon capsid-like protein domain-containing protein n=1 Tax=Ascobolus immersus RN42 TaxID=1160509 RepID=A0A3N4HJL7_ASCIM|nr:hypothetical protein BJ508DRAFT_314108 [Ascobolus immersus RN42]
MTGTTTPVKRERHLLDLQSPRRGPPAQIANMIDDELYKTQVYTCIPTGVDVTSIPLPKTHNDAFRLLFEALGEDNTALDEILWSYVESIGEGENDGPDIIEAINRQFEIIRIHARYALSAYEESKRFAAEKTKRVRQLESDKAITLAAHESETDSLHRELENLQKKCTSLEEAALKTTTESEDKLPDWLRTAPLDHSTHSTKAGTFEIPKALRLPLQANPITAFDGTGDTETVFKFIKSLDHHSKLLIDDFNDAQRIKYATGYLAGTALDWALQWRRDPTHTTWSSFMKDFRSAYVSQNAHIYLTNKLEKMELKASAIDTFNHEFKTTLQLLNLDPRTVLESSQYFQIYTRKIKDPHIVMAIQQLSFAQPLYLEMVMTYAARLMAAKLASQPARTYVNQRTTPAKGPPKPPRRPFQSKAHYIDIDDDEELDANAITNPKITSSQTAPSSTNGTSTAARSSISREKIKGPVTHKPGSLHPVMAENYPRERSYGRQSVIDYCQSTNSPSTTVRT